MTETIFRYLDEHKQVHQITFAFADDETNHRQFAKFCDRNNYEPLIDEDKQDGNS